MYPLRQNQDVPQGCTIVSRLPLPCLCIPSLPWLATVWICPLELREGHGGWSLFPTNKKWGTRTGFHAQEPHRVLLGFIPSREPLSNVKIFYKCRFPLVKGNLSVFRVSPVSAVFQKSQVKMILMLESHVLGWHILLCINSQKGGTLGGTKGSMVQQFWNTAGQIFLHFLISFQNLGLTLPVIQLHSLISSFFIEGCTLLKLNNFISLLPASRILEIWQLPFILYSLCPFQSNDQWGFGFFFFFEINFLKTL